MNGHLHRVSLRRCAWVLALLPALAALAACGGSSSTAASPVIAKDALGNSITIPAKAPQRIITLLPSDSEIIAALGADARVVGVDAYTDFPADLAAKPKVTSTSAQKLNLEQIVALQPDLVLSYGGAAYYGTDEQQLIAQKISVVDLPAATTVQDTLTDVQLVGQLLHEDDKARQLVSSYSQRIDAVKSKVSGKPPVSVFLEDGSYNGQFFAFGKGTYGDDLIRLAGGSNVFGSDGTNNGALALNGESIIAAKPDVIALAEDPQYGGDPSAAAARPGWSVIPAVQLHRVYAVDVNNFGRPVAPRLVSALEELAKDLHPDAFN